MDLLALNNSPDAIAALDGRIRRGILQQSPNLTSGQFTRIAADDLERLFRLYDESFFAGWLGLQLQEKSGHPLHFRLSTTMTRTGGKTTRARRRVLAGSSRDQYEIAIAGKLLLMTFDEIQRPVEVCGLPCADRLAALQRIMEHEILHLAEFLTWGRSSCAKARFKHMAKGIFGHAGTKHGLVTPHERASVRQGISVGSDVEFAFQGARLVGRVNRIGRRATVLVESSCGRRYTDGKNYDKYYIPVPMLQPLQDRPLPEGPPAQ